MVFIVHTASLDELAALVNDPLADDAALVNDPLADDAEVPVDLPEVAQDEPPVSDEEPEVDTSLDDEQPELEEKSPYRVRIAMPTPRRLRFNTFYPAAPKASGKITSSRRADDWASRQTKLR